MVTIFFRLEEHGLAIAIFCEWDLLLLSDSLNLDLGL